MKEDEYNFKTHIITRFNHTTYSSILMHKEVYTKKDANDGARGWNLRIVES